MTLLDERFEIVEEIGRGAQAITYRAIDHESGEVVAIKELDFRRLEDWKSQQLFEREGQTLQSLQHPSIPRYVAAFSTEDDETVRLFLAQEFVDGPTLADELAAGRRWTEDELIADAMQLLKALRYLHERSPPVVHRDIKPSNIIRRTDGRLALVDFGAVQNALPRTVGGSTVIGTPGYMPMEQLMGRAVPASDLYALGATFVHLLTATPPSQLPVVRSRLQFADRLLVTTVLRDVLEKLTQPDAEDRYGSAAQVIDDLTAWSAASTLDHDDSSGEFDRPRSHWNSLEETVLDDDSSGEFVRVDHAGRTLAFPRWTTVEPRADGEFFLEFETRDVDERDVRFEISDRAHALTVQMWRSRPRRLKANPLWGFLAVAIIAGVLFAVPRAGMMPAMIGGALFILFFMAFSSSEELPSPALTVRISADEIEMTRDGDVMVRSRTSDATWFRDGDDSRLYIRAPRLLPAIELSPNNAYQVAWFQRFLATRTREIARQSGRPPTDVVLDFEKERSSVGVEEHEPAQ